MVLSFFVSYLISKVTKMASPHTTQEGGALDVIVPGEIFSQEQFFFSELPEIRGPIHPFLQKTDLFEKQFTRINKGQIWGISTLSVYFVQDE
jgi:hypothetical protein